MHDASYIVNARRYKLQNTSSWCQADLKAQCALLRDKYNIRAKTRENCIWKIDYSLFLLERVVIFYIKASRLKHLEHTIFSKCSNVFEPFRAKSETREQVCKRMKDY